VNLRNEHENGQRSWTSFVTDIDYNARGQRELIAYGNGTQTAYAYDPLTFRLAHLKTIRPATPIGNASQVFQNATVVQDLHYTYDPAGNITRLEDAALKTIFDSGQQVEPVCRYTYDAIYRLTEAKGREHIGQTVHDFNPPDGTYRDYPLVGHRHPDDLQKLRNYTERYEYDPVGNFQFMRHIANGGSWMRRYDYEEDSLIETGKKNNRLTRTTVGNGLNFIETYIHDAHGNMIDTSSMAAFVWDFEDQLQQVDLGGGGTAYYGYDAGGQRVRKVIESQNGTRRKERIYLGGFEIYREFNGNGAAVALERESLHVMDDKERIALVETQTMENGNPINAPVPLQRYQFGNHLGSASVELDKDGALISYEEYHPYGMTAYQAGRSAAEVSLKRYRYTGKERDEESGLYYHEVRYYAPWLGRWLAPDPAEYVDGLNTFGYVRNNPILLRDPSGENAEDLVAGKAWERQVFDLIKKKLPIVEQVTVKAQIGGKTVESVLDALGRDANGWVVLESKLNPGTKLTRAQTLIREHLSSGGKVTISATDKAKIAELRDKLKVGPNTSVSTSRYEIVNKGNVGAVLSDLDVIPKGHGTVLHKSGELTVHTPEEMKKIQDIMAKHPSMDMTSVVEKARATVPDSGKTASLMSDIPSGHDIPSGKQLAEVTPSPARAMANVAESGARRGLRRLLMAIPVADIIYQQIDYENTAYTGDRPMDAFLNLTIAEVWEIPLGVVGLGELLWEGAKIQGRLEAENAEHGWYAVPGP
jgi:RHS repeat-associated protein